MRTALSRPKWLLLVLVAGSLAACDQVGTITDPVLTSSVSRGNAAMPAAPAVATQQAPRVHR